MIHSFAGCELDEERRELRRRGKPVRLEPKVFDVLAHLVRHPERVVTKAELLDHVWAGVVVSESVLPKCVAAARRAVGDSRGRPSVIRTVHGRGYRVVADVHARSGAEVSEPTMPGVEASFVGRADARARLLRALDGVPRGRGRLVVLLGESGIGKTRTAELALDEARRRGLAVAIGRAREGDSAPAFWPWSQIFRALAAMPDVTARLARGDGVTPELARLLEIAEGAPSAHADGGMAGDDARLRLFDDLTRALGRIAETRPLVLLLDDLHWADAASLRLLAFLASAIETMPVVVIATCRDDAIDRTKPLADLFATLARGAACEWLPLAGLARDECAALIGRLLAHEPSSALLDTIHALTSGNPFFIQEIAQLLTVEGESAVTDLAVLSHSLPRRIRDALRRRLANLSGDCRALLRVASVLGLGFDAPALVGVVAWPPPRVLRLLGEARAHRLLESGADAPAHYAFRHALIRHALYDELDDAERVRWHGRVGDHLATRTGGDPDADCDAIAAHYFAALSGGEAERAADACARAAARASRVFAYEQSVSWYERALQAVVALPAADPARRIELMLALAEARAAAGQRDGARDVFARGAEMARHIGRADLLARAALGYRGPTEMGAPSDAPTVALLEEALAAVGDDHPVLRARLLSRMAGTPPCADVMATRSALSHEAFLLAEATGDERALRDALSARLWAALGPDHVDARLAVGRELLAFSRRGGGLPMAMLAHDAVLGAHLLRGDMVAAERALAAYGEVAAELRQPAFLFLATFWRGSLALARGDLDHAESAFRAALERGRGTVPYAHFMYVGQMYPILHLRGREDDPELSRIFFGDMMALPYAFEPAVRSALAFGLWVRGERDGARREYARVVARVEAGLERDEHWLVTLAGVARLAVLLGDGACAGRLYDLLAPYAELVVMHDLLRSVGEPVAAILGHLSIVLGRFDAGVDHYERALAKAEAMGARLALGDVRAGYARLLARRGGPGDGARAATLEREVATAGAALGIRRNWLLEELPA